jgi:alkanesulfonate monooxygenase
VYATAPESARQPDGPTTVQLTHQIGDWLDGTGIRGALVYTDNRLVDPWLLARELVGASKVLRPLVAIQPIYMHPYSVAKLITSFAMMYGRGIDINLVAGGFRGDLMALDDRTPHNRRYDRLVEYAEIIMGLLGADGPVTYDGEFYRVVNLRLLPRMDEELLPEWTLSGSSEAGVTAADRLGARPVQYPAPGFVPLTRSGGQGVRVGVLAGPSNEAAWEEARRRFPDDPEGRRRHKLAMRISDSEWHSRISQSASTADGPYWYGPFEASQTYCPYLVGSHEFVGAELRRLVNGGIDTFILDTPRSREEVTNALAAFQAGRLEMDG